MRVVATFPGTVLFLLLYSVLLVILYKLQISNVSLFCMSLCVALYMILPLCSSLCSQMGHIQYFFLEDWKMVTDFCHSIGIRELYANQMGTHLVVVDDKSEGYVYNPVSLLMATLVQKLV